MAEAAGAGPLLLRRRLKPRDYRSGAPAGAQQLGRAGNGLALGRFSVIYATTPCVITPGLQFRGHALYLNSCA